MKPLLVPKFVGYQEAFDSLKNATKPITIMILGTIWSPPCRYTMQALTNVMQEKKYSDKIETFFIDQEANVQFCIQEEILVGFPTILVFVNSFIVPFVSQLDPSAPQKNRLIHQCNEKQIRLICDAAFDALDGKVQTITCDF